MPITQVTAFKDSWGNTHERLLDAHIEEVMGVYYEERPPSDEVIDSNCQNELTRWAAEGVVKKLSRIVEAVFGEGAQIIVPEQIEEMQQVMAETQPSHEVRMQKALSALGFDYGDSENMPDSFMEAKKVETLKDFFNKHFDGYYCTAPSKPLDPKDAGNDTYLHGYRDGAMSVVDDIKRAIEEDIKGLGLKL